MLRPRFTRGRRWRICAAEAGILRAGGRARRAFLQPGARMDPETALFDLWRRAGTTGLRGNALRRLCLQDGALQDGREAEDLEAGPDGPSASFPPPDDPGAGGDPVARAAGVLARARAARPGQEAVVLIEADATLARALGWPRLLPLLATGPRGPAGRQPRPAGGAPAQLGPGPAGEGLGGGRRPLPRA